MFVLLPLNCFFSKISSLGFLAAPPCWDETRTALQQQVNGSACNRTRGTIRLSSACRRARTGRDNNNDRRTYLFFCGHKTTAAVHLLLHVIIASTRASARVRNLLHERTASTSTPPGRINSTPQCCCRSVAYMRTRVRVILEKLWQRLSVVVGYSSKDPRRKVVLQ